MDNKAYSPEEDAKTGDGQVSLVNMNRVNPDMNGKVEQNGKVTKEEEKEDGDEKKKEEPKPMVGVFSVFRFADKLDWIYMILGWLCAAAHGTSLPLLLLVFGDMTDVFIGSAKSNDFLSLIKWNETGTTIEAAADDMDLLSQIATNQGLDAEFKEFQDSFVNDLLEEMKKFALYYVALACGVIVVAWGQVSFCLLAAFRQTRAMRLTLFRSILRMEIGWYDVHDTGELNTRLTDDVNKVQEGIGDKIGNFFQWFSCFIAGIVIGFIYGWKLTLVIMAFAPLLAISGGFMTVMLTNFTNKELKAYAKAGAIAEEVLGGLRTVIAFGGQEKECARYETNLKEAMTFGRRKGAVQGGGMGLVFFIIFVVYAIIFWYGCKLVRDEPENYSAGVMLIVFFCVVIGAFALGNAAPSIGSFSTARGAAHTLWEIIDTVPSIDSASKEGEKLSEVNGNIEFRGVKFRYPARVEVQVMSGVNLTINRGQTVALVGPSGCGKSTTIQLLQRFYDPEAGTVYLDGVDIKQLNVTWLREQIGVVSQEPILFGTTIGENIRYGREGVTQAEIEQAAKESNAHNFIMKLPQKYDTLCGERGAQLSGGQKQRIAIARALVRNPKILLLDEATSALDTESEASVQSALDKARQGRTTIVIAHRLSTVRTADIIVGIEAGQVMECGTHDELMDKQGIYYTLVQNQSRGDTGEDDDDFDDDKDVDMDIKRYGADRESNRNLSRKISTTEKKPGLQRTLSNLDKEDKEDEDLPEIPASRLWRMNSPEWCYIIVGIIAALANGVVQPAFAIIFAEILGIFVLPIEEQKEEALFLSMMFLVIGVVTAIAMFLQGYMFAISGEFMTLRLRSMAFKTYLQQEIAYFDDHKNSVGALTTRLATDASAVQGATGVRLGVIVSTLSSIGTGIIIGFIFSWELTLGILAFVPFILIAGVLQMKMLGGFTKEGQEALEYAGKVAVEAIENIRTVAALTKEETMVTWYANRMHGPFKVSLKKAIVNGITFSITQALIFFAYACSFYLGAYLVKERGLSFEDMFKVFSAIVFSAMQAGNANSMAPDYKKAMVAASRIFMLLDRVPSINNMSQEGKTPSGDIKGEVEFKGVKFNYPTRETVPVLQGLDLKVSNGKTLALVGSSGCGKSTTIQLMQRFYDPLDGQLTIDGNVVGELNLQWLRKQIGLVSQEPVLFDASIKENIAYGDNSRDVPMDEIIAAARKSNIHSFIDGLPNGYETSVGDKGTQMSGGQKQRIAIARALIRNPKILLLDEATSALDTESEKVVQEALDRAQEGRTSIVIAHRLSTIQNADTIAVIHNGKVVELGTHSELIAMQGKYYKLNNAQMRRK